MQSRLAVSVVMAVYDSPNLVRRSIASVVAQQAVELELIIVVDGASKAVREVVNGFSDDPRVRRVEQDNAGLTKALIKGCAIATYDYIARLDAGDIMQPGRLIQQAQLLDATPAVGVVSSWVTVATEEGYHLYDIQQSGEELEEALRLEVGESIKSPFHASVMFRKSLYESVGGYREQFYFTQDCDLWCRMIEHAGISVIPATLTVGLFSPKGLSGLFRDYQSRLIDLVAEANAARRAGQAETPILAKAALLRPSASRGALTVTQEVDGSRVRMDEFNGNYFIASVLSGNRSKHAKEYWWRALRSRPWDIRLSVRWLLSLRYRD